ncbi:hypothetical protein JYU34_019721, partial [Plutella xylostella]
MEKLKFEFTILPGGTDEKSNICCVTSISTENNDTYKMPDEYQSVSFHKELQKSCVFTKIKNTLTKRHQTRRVWITMTNELEKIYRDEEGNFQFEGKILEEINKEEYKHEQNTTDKFENKTKENKPNLKNIAERFILEKFTSKNTNANYWIEIFEKECGRFDVNTDEMKIEILRLFMDRSCADWYSSMIMKLTLNSAWATWKCMFCETFANKGWSLVTYALQYKYKEGSLLDYAMRKEKLILEMRRSIDSGTLIDLIATGLPPIILNKIDREALNNTIDLFNEIRKHEYMINKRSFVTSKKPVYTVYSSQSRTNNEQKPCKNCERLNKGTRYHPEDTCWFKQRIEETEKRVNNALRVNGIYDTGSNVSLINSKLLKLKGEGNNLNEANLTTISGVIKANGLTNLKIKIMDIEENVDIYVINEKQFKYDFLIGLDLIKTYKLVQTKELKILQIKEDKEEYMMVKKPNETKSLNEENEIEINFNEHVKEEDFEVKVEHLKGNERTIINELIEKYQTVFAKHKFDIGV